jgi:O-antigen/teichoic acid export membrane protein
MALAVFILSVGDRFVLSLFRPIAEVGIYAATYSLADLAARLLPSIVLVTLRPRIFRAWDGQRTEWALGRARDTAIVLGWLGAAVGVMLLLASFVGRPLPIDVGLVGPISAGLTCLFGANALGLIYTAAGRQQVLAGQIFVTAAGAVIANIYLAPILGARGAALVTLLTYTSQLALAWLGLRRILPSMRTPGHWLVASVVAATAAIAATSWWFLTPLVLVPVACILLAVVPALVAITRRLLTESPA